MTEAVEPENCVPERQGQHAFHVSELPEHIIEAVSQAKMAPGHDHLNALMNDDNFEPSPMPQRVTYALEDVKGAFGDQGLRAVIAFMSLGFHLVDLYPDAAPSFVGLGPDIILSCGQVADQACGMLDVAEHSPQPGFDASAPDNVDCLAKARPGEPMFILLGRDPVMEATVRFWADAREQATWKPAGAAGALPDSLKEWGHVRAARAVADAARDYRRQPDDVVPPPGEFVFERSGADVVAIRQGVFCGMGKTEAEALAAAQRRMAIEAVRDGIEMDWT